MLSVVRLSEPKIYEKLFKMDAFFVIARAYVAIKFRFIKNKTFKFLFGNALITSKLNVQKLYGCEQSLLPKYYSLYSSFHNDSSYFMLKTTK